MEDWNRSVTRLIKTPQKTSFGLIGYIIKTRKKCIVDELLGQLRL